MDPQETLNLCIEALQQKDYEACFYHAQDLRTWLSKGGPGAYALQTKEDYEACSDGSTPLLNVDVMIWCRVTMRICKQRQWDGAETVARAEAGEENSDAE